MREVEFISSQVNAMSPVPVAEPAPTAAQPPYLAEIDVRGEFPTARATLMGISDRDAQSCWLEYDSRLARVQELDHEFVQRMTGIFPSQELTQEDIRQLSLRNLGVFNGIGKLTLGKFIEPRRDESTIDDIRTRLDEVRITQALVMLGLPETEGIDAIHSTINSRLPNEISENERMSVYCALGIRQHYKERATN